MRRERRRAADDEFVAFVRGSQLRLRRLAFLVCGDWHRAEDIVQTALAQVYVRWSRVRSDTGPDAYARRAVVNAAIDEGRRPWRREHAVESVPDASARADDRIDESIVDALSSLPARQRAVIVLRYVDDIDVAQTAHFLGISEGTVKSQSSKGLAALRERLSKPTLHVDQGVTR